MSLAWRGGRASFPEVDWQGNRHLLEEAKRAGIRKFVYVAVNPAGAADDTIYVQSHEKFVSDLRTSGIDYTVVRPTGFFGFYAEALAQAKHGRALVIGTGAARTNPIQEAEVARACIEAADESLRVVRLRNSLCTSPDARRLPATCRPGPSGACCLCCALRIRVCMRCFSSGSK